jgi:2-succinyl-5-enolpyruvyl-6-hydroxy-3-cyclohexene-1-carboxylate synthase
MTASFRAQQVLVDLVARGVTDVVLSPGSRSGPLARAAAAADAQGFIRLHVRIDEREAAFLALGMAKASGRITPVVTTSGTAVANLHPAMLEALHSRVPLLAVTADRRSSLVFPPSRTWSTSRRRGPDT